MSLAEYRLRGRLVKTVDDDRYYSLIMVAYELGDPDNCAKIEREWPDVVAEFKARCDAWGGVLPNDVNVRQKVRGER